MVVKKEVLESDYEWRDRAIEWLKGLPEGREGTVQFLNGLTDVYVKAFALSITVYSPYKYSIHWFDDTHTEVTMDSNIEDYRYTAMYFAEAPDFLDFDKALYLSFFPKATVKGDTVDFLTHSWQVNGRSVQYNCRERKKRAKETVEVTAETEE